LEPYIKVDKEKIARKRFLIHGIRFNLDKDILQKIQQAQHTGRHLHISRELLTDLRYYALLEEDNHLQSGLTFCTYYLRSGSEEALMRSVISADGDIFHQIKSDCLESPNFCRRIASAHYWLIRTANESTASEDVTEVESAVLGAIVADCCGYSDSFSMAVNGG
jgi:hypothetical protein